eukprot:CAMPEP_0116886754 /NCGR_PEP_ID=MMETSP0463-20121206/20707_1 /TAXON_ID=181622 /ORGANISM="Strombidinopsis sp, Strain SopsisLIS2011" /LENGTH=41 /DNA_ID= /DNA_START= /DNA_END= /DNA_ORIENTATION=
MEEITTEEIDPIVMKEETGIEAIEETEETTIKTEIILIQMI